MTKNRKAKTATRRRMEKTGESFSIARLNIRGAETTEIPGQKALKDHGRDMAEWINLAIPGAPHPLWARCLDPNYQFHFHVVLDTEQTDPAGDHLSAVRASLRVAAAQLEETFELGYPAWEYSKNLKPAKPGESEWAKKERYANACGLSAVAREMRRMDLVLSERDATQPKALQSILNWLPEFITEDGFWRNLATFLLERISVALGQEATAKDILRHASLPKQDLAAWAETLPANNPAKTWLLDNFGPAGNSADPDVLASLQFVFARMADAVPSLR